MSEAIEAMVDGLSEKEQACLTHARRAQSMGLSFAEYCRRADLKVERWYWIREGKVCWAATMAQAWIAEVRGHDQRSADAYVARQNRESQVVVPQSGAERPL